MNLKVAIPVIHVSDMEAALEFYCEGLGFSKEWDYSQGEAEDAVFYWGLQREGIWIHLSSFPGDGISGAVVSFIVEDVDALFDEFTKDALNISLEPFDQTWGNREMYLEDPDGNQLRFIQYKK